MTTEPGAIDGAQGARRPGPELRLQVRVLDDALRFAREVLGAEVELAEPGRAIVRRSGAEWTLIADAACANTVMRELAGLVVRRGAGIELVVRGLDPDALEQRARQTGHGVLTASQVAADGVREARVVDRDGYVWLARAARG
ncbi:MAG: hypothetical protein IPJ77_23090 [Planctomycetes bacterium]|nr:hypothetical protein [Planctomycetota bacterium]